MYKPFNEQRTLIFIRFVADSWKRRILNENYRTVIVSSLPIIRKKKCGRVFRTSLSYHHNKVHVIKKNKKSSER